MKYSKLMLVFITLLVAGCATGPKYTEVSSSIPAMQPDKGRIYFYRTANMFGSGIQPKVKLNGEIVGKSKPGGFFFVDREPGNYKVVLSTETDKKLSFQLEPGNEKYVRMTVGLGLVVYRVYPELEDKNVAMEEIRDLSYIGDAMK
jgi:hypothetical protein